MTRGTLMFLILTVLVMTACTQGFDYLTPLAPAYPYWSNQ